MMTFADGNKLFCIIFTIIHLIYADELYPKYFYDYSVVDINGTTVDLHKYKGTVSLVVNVASKCGYTDAHYKALTKLQLSLGSTEPPLFQVLAFPCNQFGNQEPAPDSDILAFARDKYRINFPIFSKIDVIGSNADLAFANLIEQSGKPPTWNFWKYLVDEQGAVVHVWGPQYSVDSIFDDVMRAVVKVGGTVESTLVHDHNDEL